MKSHVNLLGILQLTWGGMGLLLGASLLLLAGGAAAIARHARGRSAHRRRSRRCCSWCSRRRWRSAAGRTLWVGRALRQHRSPGRTGALLLAVMNLFVLPFGTALAIYAFWVLLHNEARALFSRAHETGWRAVMPLHTEKTSTGLDANVAAALSYLVGFVTGIIFLLVEKENKFVRFHAMQSTLLFLGIVAVDILLRLVPILGALVVVFVVIPAVRRPLAAPDVQGVPGEEYKLPLVGQMAADRI